MEHKIFKAGKSLILFQVCSAIFLIICSIVFGLISGWSSVLMPPLFFAVFILIRVYLKIRKPIFLISEKEVEIFNPPRKTSLDKIATIVLTEEKKLELILTEGMPIPLFLHDLSKADREDLKHYIETMINRAKKA